MYFEVSTPPRVISPLASEVSLPDSVARSLSACLIFEGAGEAMGVSLRKRSARIPGKENTYLA